MVVPGVVSLFVAVMMPASHNDFIYGRLTTIPFESRGTLLPEVTDEKE